MELLQDMHRLGPAPTLEREMAAAAANVVLLLVAVGLLVFAFESSVAAVVLVALGLVYQAVRLVVAARRRRAGVSR